MENNMENIPSKIFDWMEQQDFDSLSADQQQEVLPWLSSREFNELHEGITNIKENIRPEKNSRHDIIKKNLMNAFDRQHSPKKSGINFSQQLLVWKAASILLLFSCALLLYSLMSQKQAVSIQPVSTTDTVYITREIAVPANAALEESAPVQQLAKPKYNHKPHVVTSESTHAEVVLQSGMNILTVKEVNAIPNQQKRNSIKDDSLVKRYSFTTL